VCASGERVQARVQQFTVDVREGLAGNARRAHARALARRARRRRLMVSCRRRPRFVTL
jgi:hypothetical protein